MATKPSTEALLSQLSVQLEQLKDDVERNRLSLLEASYLGARVYKCQTIIEDARRKGVNMSVEDAWAQTKDWYLILRKDWSGFIQV